MTLFPIFKLVIIIVYNNYMLCDFWSKNIIKQYYIDFFKYKMLFEEFHEFKMLFIQTLFLLEYFTLYIYVNV